ncbi:uncharacterized protein L969DRAFT_95331 [Mixia osmundae IAM 14324]|uniref:Uncharacterized protein n=1 Tax=Mixia osmundae (strain CBS 9802 / IAM 14324 / JCM 22182 / KY 12970) TaxID=764103 RepID=G7DZ22_MIXOS|nr:uncharacterized protein L969DRAFT_95331 [Mixia osmundae IAM 14324]KEI38234.1 hypothetical protein L969DRAFT_95331 [Mixia osmundae IAM 14324]GAA95832.1 hypothetical protein E5Q_02489 [Mixia osmundae IAM 14324]
MTITKADKTVKPIDRTSGASRQRTNDPWRNTREPWRQSNSSISYVRKRLQDRLDRAWLCWTGLLPFSLLESWEITLVHVIFLVVSVLLCQFGAKGLQGYGGALTRRLQYYYTGELSSVADQDWHY